MTYDLDTVIIGKRPEAGCNCEHLAPGAVCADCSGGDDDGPRRLVADGGRGLEGPGASHVHPDDHIGFTDPSLDERVDELEERVDALTENLLGTCSRIEFLEDPVRELEGSE